MKPSAKHNLLNIAFFTLHSSSFPDKVVVCIATLFVCVCVLCACTYVQRGGCKPPPPRTARPFEPPKQNVIKAGDSKEGTLCMGEHGYFAVKAVPMCRGS